MNRVIRWVCIILMSCWGYVMGIVHDYRTGLKKIRYLDRWSLVEYGRWCTDTIPTPVSSPPMRKCEPRLLDRPVFLASVCIVLDRWSGVFLWLIRNIAKWIANDVDLFREMRRESSIQAFIAVYPSFSFSFLFSFDVDNVAFYLLVL